MSTTLADARLAEAGQLQLTWWRFKRHRLALISLFVIALFYLVAIFADFLAVADPHATDARRSYIPPQAIHLFDDSGFNPHVNGLKGARDMKTFKLVYVPDPSRNLHVVLLPHGYAYNLFGLIPTDRHLLGLEGAQPADGIFLLGTDQLGRDLFSRLMVATRISLSIGLASVGLSLALGVLLGGISGLYGGIVDTLIQRLIEVIRSIPTIPLWMAIAASLPNSWNVVQIYFAITLIISLIGWTELARVVRGRFLALREEDFVIAAELAGAGPLRIILRHMLPSFTSHVIAATSLALPANPKQTATPAAPISSMKFSTSNCAARRDLRAPKAALTASSRCRVAPRASCIPTTFTHDMMRSRATELRRISRIGRAGAASLSESGVIRTSIPARIRLNCGGSSSASARTSAVNSARACSGVTPGRRRARALSNLN